MTKPRKTKILRPKAAHPLPVPSTDRSGRSGKNHLYTNSWEQGVCTEWGEWGWVLMLTSSWGEGWRGSKVQEGARLYPTFPVSRLCNICQVTPAWPQYPPL